MFGMENRADKRCSWCLLKCLYRSLRLKYMQNTAHYRFFFSFFLHRFQFLSSILLEHLYESTTPLRKAIVKDFVLQHNLYIFI